MDLLKQVLQLKRDGIAIKEIVRRTGTSRNSVRKYFANLIFKPNQSQTKK